MVLKEKNKLLLNEDWGSDEKMLVACITPRTRKKNRSEALGIETNSDPLLLFSLFTLCIQDTIKVLFKKKSTAKYKKNLSAKEQTGR